MFKAAPPIAGGREFLTNGQALEQGSVPNAINNFQARYAIRYPWEGPIACANPVRGQVGRASEWRAAEAHRRRRSGPGEARRRAGLEAG